MVGKFWMESNYLITGESFPCFQPVCRRDREKLIPTLHTIIPVFTLLIKPCHFCVTARVSSSRSLLKPFERLLWIPKGVIASIVDLPKREERFDRSEPSGLLVEVKRRVKRVMRFYGARINSSG